MKKIIILLSLFLIQNSPANNDKIAPGSLDFLKNLTNPSATTQDAGGEEALPNTSWEHTEEGKKIIEEYEASKKAKEEEQKKLDKMNFYQKQRYLREKKQRESEESSDSPTVKSSDF